VEQRTIGTVFVGAIALGTASLSLDASVTRSEASRTILAALDAGISLIDTAAAYTMANELAHNETLIREVLRTRAGNDAFVSTKGGHTRQGGSWGIDGRPRAIREDCERSLTALGVDQIDLYFLHKPDPLVPFVDSIGALEDLRREGKVARTGISNVTLPQLHEALTISPIAAVQNHFSVLDQADRLLIDESARLGITYLAYSPLGGSTGSGGLADRLPRSAARAQHLGISVQRHLLAWTLTISANIIPVVGARREAACQRRVNIDPVSSFES
jgi:aryl-alcohol dehydrogenase-like predicted oxidoreductase